MSFNRETQCLPKTKKLYETQNSVKVPNVKYIKTNANSLPKIINRHQLAIKEEVERKIEGMKLAGVIRDKNNEDNAIEIDNRGWQPHIT